MDRKEDWHNITPSTVSEVIQYDPVSHHVRVTVPESDFWFQTTDKNKVTHVSQAEWRGRDLLTEMKKGGGNSKIDYELVIKEEVIDLIVD